MCEDVIRYEERWVNFMSMDIVLRGRVRCVRCARMWRGARRGRAYLHEHGGVRRWRGRGLGRGRRAGRGRRRGLALGARQAPARGGTQRQLALGAGGRQRAQLLRERVLDAIRGVRRCVRLRHVHNLTS